ncbi:MAG: hypothetical protein HS111_30475 [Kofleriaceae bacterium]|nr:hypothetical protein [Kofleriaceae bacterium]MCL4224654.1 hypothetical protein [Myxococcales bacterium]
MIKTRLALSAFGLALCATAAPALAGDGTNLYGMLAQDTQMVMVFDVADSRDSTLLQKGFQKLLAMQPDAQAKLGELGIDPMKDVDTIALAAGGMKDFDEMDNAQSFVLIIEGRLPRGKLAEMDGARKAAYKGVDIWTMDDTDAAFVGDRLFFTRKGKMKAQIDLAQGKAKARSLAGSAKAKAMRAALAVTDTSADLWIAVLMPDKTKKEMAREGIVAHSVSGGANFTADLALSIRIDSDSEDGARKAVGMLQAQLGQATGMMTQFGLGAAAKSLSVTSDKAAIKMGIKFTEAEINSILALAGGGMGGGASAPPPPPPPPPGKSPMRPTK